MDTELDRGPSLDRNMVDERNMYTQGTISYVEVPSVIEEYRFIVDVDQKREKTIEKE